MLSEQRDRPLHRYAVYGLVIASELPLPGLQHWDGEEDLVIRFGGVAPEPPEDIATFGYYALRPDRACYFWRGTGRFAILEGRRIVMQTEPGASLEEIAGLILGQFIAIAMHQRGRFVVHGSGVEIDGEVVGFIADSGGGKSTMAAALGGRGHTIVTDDLIPVELDLPRKLGRTFPGHPQVKLWPEAASALGSDPGTMARIPGPRDKRLLDIPERSPMESFPLSRLYVLQEGPLAIEPLSPMLAFREVMHNSYCASLVERMGDAERHFMECSRLASIIPVRRLSRPLEFGMLEEVVRMVEMDLRNAR